MSDDRAIGEEVKEAGIIARARKKFPKTWHLMRPFLDAYERVENQTLAAKETGVGHNTITHWKKHDGFMKLFTAAHLRAQRKNNDSLKGSALQRAINGSPRYVIQKGQVVKDKDGNPVVMYRDFETQLTMFMLKNRMPEEFKDKFEHEISGQIIMTLTSEFSTILRKHVPAQFMPAITKELETLSAKLVNT